MAATRLAGRIASALMCAIFLLGCTGCPLTSNIDEIKEDAYKQGYEQGLKDNSKTPTKAPSLAPERKTTIPYGNIYVPNYGLRTPTTPSTTFGIIDEQEQDQQQLEDEIEQLKMEADFARREAESAKIEAETRLYFERKKAEYAQYDMEHQEYLRTHPWAKKPWE